MDLYPDDRLHKSAGQRGASPMVLGCRGTFTPCHPSPLTTSVTLSGSGDPKKSGGRGQLKSRSDPPTDPFGTHINMYIQLNFYRVC